MFSPLTHHCYSTFAGFFRSRQAVAGLLLVAAGALALLWLPVESSVALPAVLAVLAWRWGRSALARGGQLVVLWLAYPVLVLSVLRMLNESGGRKTEQSVVLAYSVVGLMLLTIFIVKRRDTARQRPSTIPNGTDGKTNLRFNAVGGLEEAKSEITKLVQSRLNARHYRKYGVVQNGVLLHGPRGTGKSLLAQATAGQFDLHFEYVSPTSLKDRWVGATEDNIRRIFEDAAAKRPVLLFLDEIDSLGAARQIPTSDPGGGRKASNDAVVQLMQCIDQYRSLPGFVLMAATNMLDGLDPALIREGRFDLKIRVDLPDKEARRKILQSLLAGKPSKVSDLTWLVARTPGFSAAKLRAVIDRAAMIVAEAGRKIEDRDLKTALETMGGKDRPLLEPVEWSDVVIDADIEQDLRELICLLNSGWQTNIHPPTGLLLVGPPGTGKSLLARLIASQSRRSFYPISASDVLGGQVGESVKKLTSVFERAKENGPSIIHFDEIDGLLPRRDGAILSQHDVQLVEQCLTEVSNLSPENQVFLIGTTNHLDLIDPRVLRGGRFSEKIRISLPSMALRRRLFTKFLEGMSLSW